MFDAYVGGVLDKQQANTEAAQIYNRIVFLRARHAAANAEEARIEKLLNEERAWILVLNVH